MMDIARFDKEFHDLTGYAPLCWQRRFYFKHLDTGNLPAGVDVPTGLGKTAVIALWLIAIRNKLQLPRRLVYVVDRRAVVDQATEFVERIRERLSPSDRFPISTLRGQHADNREWLDDPSRPAVVVGTVDMIGSRLLFGGYGVSRKMRPYHAGLLGADTLIVLDESHLVPPFEHLLESIETCTDSLAAREDEDRALIPRMHLLSLSATGQERKGEVFRLTEEDMVDKASLTRRRLNAAKTLTISDGDAKKLPHELADAAWALTGSGTRPMRCLVYCNSRDHAEKTIGELQKRSKQRSKNAGVIPEVVAELFIGARRGHEREIAAARLHELGFLAGSEQRDDRIRFLIATSAGEVGVDLDADHMVCDLVAWDRMVQRLGRVNRRGNGNAQIKVITTQPELPEVKRPKHPGRPRIEPSKPEKLKRNADDEAKKRHQTAKDLAKEYKQTKKKYEKSLKQHKEFRQHLKRAYPEYRMFVCWKKAIEQLNGDASPGSIRNLRNRGGAIFNKATTQPPLRPALTRALLDAWSMTSIREHTGRPEIAPWLRGWVDDEPQTVVLWRTHLPVPESDRERQRDWGKDITAFFEAAPPHLSERLETETYRVAEWLVARANALKAQAAFNDTALPGGIVAIVLDTGGDFSQTIDTFKLASASAPKGASEGDKRRAKRAMDGLKHYLAGKTLIMHHTLGGPSKKGTLDPVAEGPPVWLGDYDEGWEEEKRKSGQRTIQWRVVRLDGDEELTHEAGWRKRYEFVLKRDAEGEASERLAVYKWKQDATNEEDRSIGQNQALKAHQSQAAKRAREIGKRLKLPEDYIRLTAFFQF